MTSEKLDFLAEFVSKRVKGTPLGNVSARHIFVAYEAFCATRGVLPMHIRHFNEAMSKLGFDRRRDSRGYFFNGLEIREQDFEEQSVETPGATAAAPFAVPDGQALVPVELLEKIAADLGLSISTATQLAAITSSAAATYLNDASLGHVGLAHFFKHHFGANMDNHHVALNALTLINNTRFLAARLRAAIPAKQATPATEESASEVRRAA